MIIAKFVAVVLIGYLLGSIPFGVLISRRSVRVDVRNYGSGKTGATNVLRVAGKKAAAVVVVLDIFKGVLAVIFAGLIIGGDYVAVGSSGFWWPVWSGEAAAALAAIAGHKWPVFLKFKGGRGTATFFGGLVALCPPAALVGGEILFLTAALTRYASVGSISGVLAAFVVLIPLTFISKFPVEYLIYALIGAIFIIVAHRDNLGRLAEGTERKLGEKAKVAGSLPSANQ
ncbi:glycerol-3-phosphate 1-O-acyltransferase PlsY [Chloroflexota bacterium]